MQKKVSVILPIYKESECQIRRAILSILTQTYKNLELVIINDNPDSFDNEKVVLSFTDSRIIYIKNERNLGITKSLNKGLERAHGDYICRMDADDFSYEYRIEKQVEYIENMHYDFIGSNINYVLNEKVIDRTKYPLTSEHINKALAYKNCMTHPTWMFRREVYLKLGFYRDYKACEDYDYLIRAVSVGFKLGNYPEILLNYTLSANGISLSNSSLQEFTARYLRKCYKKNIVSSYNDYMEMISSQKSKRRMAQISKYLSIKNKRTYFRNNKFKYICLTIVMIFYIYDFFYDLNCKIKLSKHLGK